MDLMTAWIKRRVGMSIVKIPDDQLVDTLAAKAE
jgi:hypothetical protein